MFVNDQNERFCRVIFKLKCYLQIKIIKIQGKNHKLFTIIDYYIHIPTNNPNKTLFHF